MTYKKSLLLTAAFFALTLHVSYALADDLPDVQQEGNITYITGGIGDDEKMALEAVRVNYNFQLLSAYTTGEYTGDTHITLSDMNGNYVMDSDAGPLFYAQLPVGRYEVEATSGGEIKKQIVTIRRGKTSSVTFRWPYNEAR